MDANGIPVNQSLGGQSGGEGFFRKKPIVICVTAAVRARAVLVNLDDSAPREALENVLDLSRISQLWKAQPQGGIPVHQSFFIAAVVMNENAEDGELQHTHKRRSLDCRDCL